MVLPTITRGVGFRDDGIDASLTQSNSGSVGGTSITSDGDNLSFSGTFTNPASLDGAIAYRPVTGAPNSSTYKNVLLRWLITAWPNSLFALEYWVHYTNGTSESGNLSNISVGNAVTSAYAVSNLALTTVNQTIDQLGVRILCTVGGSGTFNFNVSWDFIYVYKENLTLPAVFEPLRPIKTRRVAVLPILGREGGVLQDLGSVETDLSISGGLFPTSQYTADQWWHVFDGLVLEAGVFQADGNETWQWLSSDLVNGKFFIMSWVPAQVMGRIAYHDYVLSLKRFDVIGETASMIGAIT